MDIHRNLLCSLHQTKPNKLKRQLLSALPDKTVRMICEVCHNILLDNVHLSKAQWKVMRKYKDTIRALGYKPYGVKLKRQILYNQKGGFLAAAIPIIASIVGGLVGNLSK